MDLQGFLRFLSQDAKVPLAVAMSKIKDLQKANLDSPEKLSKAKADELKPIFDDEKVSKQIIAAAKRISKKRAAGDDTGPTRNTKRKKDLQLFSEEEADTPQKLESSVALPASTLTEDELAQVVVFTNRAPLVLAFVVSLLKYTMPEQPLTSRLSLAQGYVSITSRSRAVSLGIESGKSAEEEGFGEGQPLVTIMGKEIRVLRRWGYEWKGEALSTTETAAKDVNPGETGQIKEENEEHPNDAFEEKPALWALDLEALKKSSTPDGQAPASMGNQSTLPIYTPQSARNYLLKSFGSPPAEAPSTAKKVSAAAKAAEKDKNLGMLLRTLDLLYASWADTISPEELDKRTWTWYVKVRPEVEHGVAGWGGKNRVKLGDILALRRAP